MLYINTSRSPDPPPTQRNGIGEFFLVTSERRGIRDLLRVFLRILGCVLPRSNHLNPKMIQAPLPDAMEEGEEGLVEGEEAVEVELGEEKEEDCMVLLVVILEGNGFPVHLLLRLLIPTQFCLWWMKEVPMPILFSRFQMGVRLVASDIDLTGQINVPTFKHVDQIMTYRWFHRLC